MTGKRWEKKAKPWVEIVTYLTPGNLIVSSATSVSFKDTGGGWNSSRKRTMTYIVWKSGQRHKKRKVKWRKVCNILNFLLVSAGFSRNDKNNPCYFAIALETLRMTVHAGNADTPNWLPVTLLHSLSKISIQNFYEVTYQVLSQAKTQLKVLVAVLLLWVKSIPKVPRNLSNVYIHRLK